MKISGTALAVSGWLTLAPVWADVVAQTEREQPDMSAYSDSASLLENPDDRATKAKERASIGEQKRPSFSVTTSAFDAYALRPASESGEFSEVSDLRSLLAEHWLDPAHAPYRQFTLGYAWRGLKYESSSIAATEGYQPATYEGLKLKSASRRLSFSPSENWTFKIGRGYVSNLDQLRADDQVKRTAIAATYQQLVGDADWQTTFAWGRNVRRFRERNTGYLMESIFRVQKAHSFFGRLEQVGSDDLYRENQSSQHPLFKVKKVTVGYFHDVRFNQEVRFDVGGLVSKHLVSSETNIYGTNPTSFMMFVRLKLQ
ncbi:MAG TPA: hypothetical protein VGU61_15490 [Noviherbaspirillum sp.]|jgi:hypothetical protein|uniref:hypothetical protein n=1 Tax=Noviherbaspirillum sp. TaxID=1926288 RepID=UPI002DDCB6DF|nr:hypothetical protein [Noviherbaspirillum sp.]HEV2611671.1 hypothetical protein [Noviherbaspirillum sp.]